MLVVSPFSKGGQGGLCQSSYPQGRLFQLIIPLGKAEADQVIPVSIPMAVILSEAKNLTTLVC